MISRRALFGVLAGGTVAAVVPVEAEAGPSAIEWEEPEWDDSNRPEGGGIWDVQWFNRVRGVGSVKNDAGEVLSVHKNVVKKSGIAFSEMRPGRSFVVRWKRTEMGKIATNLKRV